MLPSHFRSASRILALVHLTLPPPRSVPCAAPAPQMWLQTGGRNPQYARMYKQSIRSMIDRMLRRNPEGLLYLPALNGNTPGREMEHLTCFTPG